MNSGSDILVPLRTNCNNFIELKMFPSADRSHCRDGSYRCFFRPVTVTVCERSMFVIQKIKYYFYTVTVILSIKFLYSLSSEGRGTFDEIEN